MLSLFIPRDVDEFLRYTWGKPRDIIRYLKSAKEAYPNNASLRGPEFGNVLRRYSQSAWQDVKAALTAFVPKQAIPALESALQQIAHHNFDSSVIYDRETLIDTLRPAHAEAVKAGVSYDLNELVKLLYVIGVFYITYDDANRQRIIHQFHRGNRHPAFQGKFYVHRALARAFS